MLQVRSVVKMLSGCLVVYHKTEARLKGLLCQIDIKSKAMSKDCLVKVKKQINGWISAAFTAQCKVEEFVWLFEAS